MRLQTPPAKPTPPAVPLVYKIQLMTRVDSTTNPFRVLNPGHWQRCFRSHKTGLGLQFSRSFHEGKWSTASVEALLTSTCQSSQERQAQL